MRSNVIVLPQESPFRNKRTPTKTIPLRRSRFWLDNAAMTANLSADEKSSLCASWSGHRPWKQGEVQASSTSGVDPPPRSPGESWRLRRALRARYAEIPAAGAGLERGWRWHKTEDCFRHGSAQHDRAGLGKSLCK